jgi:hypothetical protein
MPEIADIDVEALDSFIQALRGFNSDLEGRWSNLKGRWNASSESWRDVKKDQFTSAVGWDEVIRMMEGYLSTAEQYTNFLIRLSEKAHSYLDS